MLDQLIESSSTSKKDSKKSGLLLGTLVVLVTVLFGSWLYSLFDKDFGMGSDELSLQTLVAPPVVEEAPQPEPEPEPQQEEAQKAPNVDVRTEVIATMTETPPKVPDKPSVTRNTVPERNPDRYTVVGNRNLNAENAPPPSYRGPTNNEGTGSNSGNLGGGGDAETGSSKPPPPPPPPPPSKPPVPKQISKGVLNGSARSLPQPAYPPQAKTARVTGSVSVQVVIDEDGNVVSATAASGHPMLRQAAVGAARRAKFSPTLLSGQAVRVSGVITYNFVL